MTGIVTDETFQAEVLDADGPVLVDFWATWCHPCKIVEPILEEIAQEYAGRITIVKLDTMTNPETTAAAGIVSIPALIVYQGGQVVKTLIGARPKKAIIAELEPFFAA